MASRSHDNGNLRSLGKDAEGEAVVIYCEPLATQVEDPANSGEMRHPRLSHWANKRTTN